jgi:SAM-dependent methyltransferase
MGQDDEITKRTLGHYNANADSFWSGTRDHDVSQNYAALLDAIVGEPPFAILDFGCGPGRDLRYFKAIGHTPVGLDGSARFAEMARRESGCEVLHQDFLALDLGRDRFHGIFANASLFHVPSHKLADVLSALHAALRERGVLFSSNPRGEDTEGWSGERYGCYWKLETWQAKVTEAGFEEITHYFRPPGRPLAEQPWLASVWRKALR